MDKLKFMYIRCPNQCAQQKIRPNLSVLAWQAVSQILFQRPATHIETFASTSSSNLYPHVWSWSGGKFKSRRVFYSRHVLVSLQCRRPVKCRNERITREINMNKIFTIIQSKCDENSIYLQLLNNFLILHWLAG